jgi:NAD(P)H-hydrate repair Nnr-like enzyme with NAD(P)H-hydrate dehydratase domain
MISFLTEKRVRVQHRETHVFNHITYHEWYTVLVCDSEGGLKRMGGQGDILSGVIATFLAWGKGYEDGAWK